MRFWWGQKEHEHKIRWNKWFDLSSTKCLGGLGFKDLGGLGFKDLGDFNLALLSRMAWRVFRNHVSLWVKVLKGLFSPNGTPLNARRGSRDSWHWSSILEGKEVLKEGAFWQIGDGKSVNI